MENKYTLKKYSSIDQCLFHLYKDDDRTLTIENIREATTLGLDENKQEVEISYSQQIEGIEQMGYWGWIDEHNVIHYWIGKDISLEELIHFIGHEIGHRTSTPCEDDFMEEMRAEEYGSVATLSYHLANEIKNNIYE